MGKKIVEKYSSPNRDELISKVYDVINSSDGNYSAFFLDEDKSDSEIVDWISTGDPVTDLCISNRKNGGIPVGRITEIAGLEGTGKSLLIAHLMAETQKRGGIAVIIDTEFATDKDFLAAIGVDLSKLIYINDSVLENAFEIIENIVETVRKNNSDRLICIAIDSIMGATDESEDESDWSKTGYATQKARVLGKAMRKITSLIAKHRIALVLTNQLRAKLNTMAFADPWTTSGGKAVPFHASLRLRLQQLNKLKIKDKVVGIKTRVKVVKSRLGSMYNTCSFDIYFDRGIDTVSTWFDVGKLYKVIIPAKKLEDETQPESKTNKYKDVKGQYMIEGDPKMTRFQLPSFKESILDVPELKQILYDAIADAVLLKYRDINQNPINRNEIEYGTGQDED